MDLNMSDYLYAVMALVFVLALIALIALAARRMGFGFSSPVTNRDKRRLSVVETLSLDARHRLVLFRRDDIEHLIVLGAESELLIENSISPPVADGVRGGAPLVLHRGGEDK